MNLLTRTPESATTGAAAPPSAVVSSPAGYPAPSRLATAAAIVPDEALALLPEESAAAADALFAELYGELHRMARRELARRGGFATLGATTLLHEAYLDISARSGMEFPDRFRFMAYASRAMRGLIIDHLRRRHAQKRGGLFEITALRTTVAGRLAGEQGLEHISEALDELATVDAELAQVVDLRFFCGFSFAEIGAMRGVSERTVQRHWEKARIYLHRAIAASDAISNLAPARG
jgi:RNA polymerase sigma factor (TIGR02999 family)